MTVEEKGCFTRRTGSSFYWSFSSFSLLMADLTVTAEVVLEGEPESFACGRTTVLVLFIFEKALIISNCYHLTVLSNRV